MKKFSIVLAALAAILVLPGSAKADSFTGASGSASEIVILLSGSGTFSASSLGGSQSFSFSDVLLNNFITIGSGASAFHGVFTDGFSNTGHGCAGLLCTEWTADFKGTGASAGETGSITLDIYLDIFSGKWVISAGNADPAGVPESGTLGMFAAGLVGVGLMLGRKAKALPVAA